MDRLSRRSFLKSTSLGATILASSAYSNPLSSLILSDKKQKNIDLDYVIFDKGIEKSEEFAQKMKALGTKTYEINKDISQMWSEVISPTWGKNKNTAIAGLTTYETMFVLERLAFDKGMLMYFNAEHNIANNNINHELQASKVEIDKIKKNLDKYDWTDALALKINNYEYERIDSKTKISTNNNKNEKNQILYSWIIAPRKVS
ncbi:hypothetical protein [Halarcobacter sp.]|uniref:hypothetical protein n=1 Tax=Halarcobacter sp. TaxID=2321133 RepID=UPI0029F4BE44|nr:hypothetical protein [Halarcobacter sp.]